MNWIEFDIISVARQCGIKLNERTIGRPEVAAKCPFCNNRRNYPLSFNTQKNRFRCNRCDVSGNAVTLYGKIYNLSNKEAFLELNNQKLIRLPNATYKEIPAAPQADLKTRHNVYHEFLSMLTLNDDHRQNLLRRGLPEGYINRFLYKSIPLDAGFRHEVVSALAARHNLHGIPGFYTDDFRNWHMFVKPQGGFFVPVCDKDGYIQGLQIRLDVKDPEERKYRWFSSNHYQDGTNASPWVHVVGDILSPIACLTEGALKADTASVLSGGKLFIAIPGVHAINELPDALQTLKIRKLVETYDMDKMNNPRVADALEKMKVIVQRLGIEYEPFKWNPDYKGIDEFLFARNVEKNSLAMVA